MTIGLDTTQMIINCTWLAVLRNGSFWGSAILNKQNNMYIYTETELCYHNVSFQSRKTSSPNDLRLQDQFC